MESSVHAATPRAPEGDFQEDAVAREGAATALAADVGQQDDEGLRMLMVGFGTGMTIAFVFLVYILLEAARLLP